MTTLCQTVFTNEEVTVQQNWLWALNGGVGALRMSQHTRFYLSHRLAAKAELSLCICRVLLEPLLLAY